MRVYRCDQCGACCRQLIVEAAPEDVLREPRIAERCEHLNGRGELPLLESAWSLACVNACPFLQPDNRCGIYATRPNECASFPAGGPKCQEARRMDGRSPLVPVEVAQPTVADRIATEIAEYERVHG